MNVYEVIRAEHNEITDIMGQLMRGGDGNRLPLLDKLQKLLDHHLFAEDELLVPRTATGGQAREDGAGAKAEAAGAQPGPVSTAELRQLLGALVEDATSPDFKDKLARLQDAMGKHVAHVEGDVFGKARAALNDADAGALGQRFESERQKAIGDGKPLTRLARGEKSIQTEDAPTLRQSIREQHPSAHQY